MSGTLYIASAIGFGLGAVTLCSLAWTWVNGGPPRPGIYGDVEPDPSAFRARRPDHRPSPTRRDLLFVTAVVAALGILDLAYADVEWFGVTAGLAALFAVEISHVRKRLLRELAAAQPPEDRASIR